MWLMSCQARPEVKPRLATVDFCGATLSDVCVLIAVQQRRFALLSVSQEASSNSQRFKVNRQEVAGFLTLFQLTGSAEARASKEALSVVQRLPAPRFRSTKQIDKAEKDE
jgi:hypothetical protein